MPHVSGRSGTMTFGAESGTEFNPGTGIDLQSWTLTQETDTFEAFSKADHFVTSFRTVTRWSGTATFLHDDGGLIDTMAIREASTEGKLITGLVLSTDGTDAYNGNAIVTRGVTESPLDGPLSFTLDFVGNGVLTFTVV